MGVNKRSLFLCTLLVVCLGTYAALAAHDFALGTDDAHISLVYASNFAHGHGFVYNVGGERVEGFSTLLWVLLTAPAFYFPGRPDLWILGLSTILTAFSYSVAAGYLMRAYRPLSAQVPPALVATIFVGLLMVWPAQITWMTASLMETALWSVLLTASAVLLLSEGERGGPTPTGAKTTAFSVVLALTILTRPESLVIAPVLVVLRLVRLAGLAGWQLAWRFTIGPILVSFVTVASLTMFRLFYFGYPLPNTYYAKVSPYWTTSLREGLSYLNAFVSAGPLMVVIFFLNVTALSLAAVFFVRSIIRGSLSELVRWTLLKDAILLHVLSGILLLVPVLNGGDHFKWWRMYQPAYPVLLMTAFLTAREGLASSRLGFHPAARVVVTTMLLVFGLFRLYDPVTWLKVHTESPVAREFRIGSNGVQGGELLMTMFANGPRLPTVAVVAAGGIKRTYVGEVQDLMGLNSTAMAHSGGDRRGIINHAAFDKSVFFTQPSEIVWAMPDLLAPSLRTRDFVRFVLRGLPDDPRFLELYEEATLYYKASGERGVTAYFRKDLVATLSSNPSYVFTKVKSPDSPER
jgi:arabinofuranosyltransferase